MVKNSSNILIDLSKNSNDLQYVYDNAVSISGTNPYALCDFAEYVPLIDNKDVMKVLEDGIIKFADIDHIYEFMFLMVDIGVKNFNLQRFEKLVKESKNPKLMAYAICFVPGIDVMSMLDSLFATKSIKYLDFLSSESDSDVSLIPGYKQATNNAKKNIYFPNSLLRFRTKDISELIKLVINSKDLYLMNELADYLEYLKTYLGLKYDMTNLEKAYLDYAYYEPLHLYEYASSIKSSNKEVFTDYVIGREMAKYMYYMYEYVTGVDKEKLIPAIKRTHNDKYINKIKL